MTENWGWCPYCDKPFKLTGTKWPDGCCSPAHAQRYEKRKHRVQDINAAFDRAISSLRADVEKILKE